MFRSLRSVAMQLDQGLAEMEELDSLIEDDEESNPPYHAPAMSGPASNVEAEPTVRLLVREHEREREYVCGAMGVIVT